MPTWYRRECGLPRHPKTAALMLASGLDLKATLGLLDLFWGFVVEYAPAGRLSRNDVRGLSQRLDFASCSDEQVIDMLIRADFVKRTRSGYIVNGWIERNGKPLKDAERMRRTRRERRDGVRERSANGARTVASTDVTDVTDAVNTESTASAVPEPVHVQPPSDAAPGQAGRRGSQAHGDPEKLTTAVANAMPGPPLPTDVEAEAARQIAALEQHERQRQERS